MFAKWWKFITKKITSLIFILEFQKNWIRIIMTLKIEFSKIQINSIVGFFYVFNVGIIIINF
jgi:hypothetical protein